MLACETGNYQLASLFLEKGVNVNARDDAGMTPLMFAVQSERTRIAQLLLDHSAAVDLADNHGITAIKIAEKSGAAEVLDLLQSKGASTNTAVDQVNVICPEPQFETIRVWANKNGKARWRINVKFVITNNTNGIIRIDDMHSKVYEHLIPTPAYLTIGYSAHLQLNEHNSLDKTEPLQTLEQGDWYQIELGMDITREEGVPGSRPSEDGPKVSAFGPMVGYGPVEGPIRTVFGIVVDYYIVTETGKENRTLQSDCLYMFQSVADSSDLKALDPITLEHLTTVHQGNEIALKQISHLRDMLQSHLSSADTTVKEQLSLEPS